MRTTRQVIAVVAVTTALCAEQCIAAAAPVVTPAGRARVGVEDLNQLAGQLVGRLTRNLRRAVANVLPCPLRRDARPAPDASPAFAARRDVPAAPAARALLSPFQFRLPPPING